MKKWWFFVFLLLIPVTGQAQLTWFLSQKESSHKWAIVPSYKRTNSLGHVLGGRVFVYPTNSQGLYLATSIRWKLNKENFIGYKGHSFYWFQNGSELEFALEHDEKFDSIYKKNSTHRVEVPSKNIHFKSQYLFPWRDSKLLLGGFFDIKHREELKRPCFLIQQSKRKTHKIILNQDCYGFSAREKGVSLGLAFRYDTRDSKFDPKSGRLIQGYSRVGYDLFEKSPLFLQLEASYRQIWSILEEERWILNLHIGGSIFNPSIAHSSLPYVYLFKLGGADKLRGYYQDRFYGNQYYLAQGELRWPWLKWLQFSLFTDIGAINFLSIPMLSFGSGVLIGLPPSYEQKIRLEMGLGQDQYNFVIAFALPY